MNIKGNSAGRMVIALCLMLSGCSGGFQKSADRSAENFSSVFHSTIWRTPKQTSAPENKKEEEKKPSAGRAQ